MNELNVAMRFLHIFSAILLLGGVLTWRFAVMHADRALAPETRSKLGDAFAVAWRPSFLFAAAGLLISGTYNFLHKTGLTREYHAIFGIKVLLALHVFAVGFLATRPNNLRRQRQLTGVAISGVAIVALSAMLRGILLR